MKCQKSGKSIFDEKFSHIVKDSDTVLIKLSDRKDPIEIPRSILMKYESYFSAIASGNFKGGQREDGSYYIDMKYLYFDIIISVFKKGVDYIKKIKLSTKQIIHLKTYANYFCIDDISKYLDSGYMRFENMGFERCEYDDLEFEMRKMYSFPMSEEEKEFTTYKLKKDIFSYPRNFWKLSSHDIYKTWWENTNTHIYMNKKINEKTYTIVPNLEEFKTNFDNFFSERSLDGLNWDNIIVAGGSVMRCLLSLETELESPGFNGNYTYDESNMREVEQDINI